jgi:predicted nucleotidyltransferase
MSAPEPTNPIDQLAEITGGNWPNLTAARHRAVEKRIELERVLSDLGSGDTSIVVFGSLARNEYTPGSDLDWTLLVDGIANPSHFDTAQKIARQLDEAGLKGPGREQTFGSFAFSHELIHQIGGQDDSNANTTRRILLLLESRPVGRQDAYDRVVNNVLSRYLTEDRGLWHGSSQVKIPRFLLNDIARYWRTITVDFAYQQRARGNQGFAIRTIKLRLSRKLVFLAGLLACYSCHLGFSRDQRAQIYASKNTQALVEHLRRVLSSTPLDILASALTQHESTLTDARAMFNAYDGFIGLMAHDAYRKRLEEIGVDELGSDSVFQEAQRFSHAFRDALSRIFLRGNTELCDLTIDYGVF